MQEEDAYIDFLLKELIEKHLLDNKKRKKDFMLDTEISIFDGFVYLLNIEFVNPNEDFLGFGDSRNANSNYLYH